jgi:hypothetical protein
MRGDWKGISINIVDNFGALFIVSGGCLMVIVLMVIPMMLVILLSLLIAVHWVLFFFLFLVPGQIASGFGQLTPDAAYTLLDPEFRLKCTVFTVIRKQRIVICAKAPVCWIGDRDGRNGGQLSPDDVVCEMIQVQIVTIHPVSALVQPYSAVLTDQSQMDSKGQALSSGGAIDKNRDKTYLDFLSSNDESAKESASMQSASGDRAHPVNMNETMAVAGTVSQANNGHNWNGRNRQ